MRNCRVFTTTLLAVLVPIVFNGVVWGHHGSSNTSYYESSADKELTLEGVVTVGAGN